MWTKECCHFCINFAYIYRQIACQFEIYHKYLNHWCSSTFMLSFKANPVLNHIFFCRYLLGQHCDCFWRLCLCGDWWRKKGLHLISPLFLKNWTLGLWSWSSVLILEQGFWYSLPKEESRFFIFVLNTELLILEAGFWCPLPKEDRRFFIFVKLPIWRLKSRAFTSLAKKVRPTILNCILL